MKTALTLPLVPPVFSGLVPGVSSIPVPSPSTEAAISAALAALVPPVPLTAAQVAQLVGEVALTVLPNGSVDLSLAGVQIGVVSAPALTPYTGAMVSAENR